MPDHKNTTVVIAFGDTKTTEYNVMNSPLKRDVVREYVDAFRKKGLT